MSRYNKNKGGFIAAIAVFLVVALLVGAFGYITSGFKNWEAETWFEKKTETETETNNLFAMDDNGNEMYSGKIYSMPVSMSFMAIAPIAGDAGGITLQATVKPDNADDKSVDWLVEWVNPLSTWVNGKAVTDYVTVTPSSDGSATANVSCFQAFGEQVRVTVVSRQNENAKADCMVDYAQRITGIEIDVYVPVSASSGITAYTIPVAGDAYVFDGVPPYEGFYTGVSLKCVPGFTTHTVADAFTYSYYLTYSPAYLSALAAQGFWLKSNSGGRKKVESLDNPYTFGLSVVDGLPNIIFEASQRIGFTYNALVAAAQTIGSGSFGTLEVVITGIHSSFTRTLDIKINPAIFTASAAEVLLDTGSLIF